MSYHKSWQSRLHSAVLEDLDANTYSCTTDMTPSTPRKERIKGSHGVEYSPATRNRFFTLYDCRGPGVSIRMISQSISLNSHTTSKWIRQRKALGHSASYRTRNLSEKLGRKPILSEDDIKLLISPAQNQNRTKSYPYQTKQLGLPQASHHTIRRALKRHTNNAQRYKALVVHEISRANQQRRNELGK